MTNQSGPSLRFQQTRLSLSQNSVYDLELSQFSTLKRLRKVLYAKETTPEGVSLAYHNWVLDNKYLIFEQKRHRSPIRQIASLVPKRGNLSMLGKFANVGKNSHYHLNINKS